MIYKMLNGTHIDLSHITAIGPHIKLNYESTFEVEVFFKDKPIIYNNTEWKVTILRIGERYIDTTSTLRRDLLSAWNKFKSPKPNIIIDSTIDWSVILKDM